MKEVGKVKWFNAEKGFGFIEREGKKDIFVHFGDIEMEGYKTLNEGELVEFTVEQSSKGEIARHIKRIENKGE